MPTNIIPSGLKPLLTKPFQKATSKPPDDNLKPAPASAKTAAVAEPPASTDAPRVLVVGAGARGSAYAHALVHPPTNVDHKDIVQGLVVGVAEPHEGKRTRFIERYISRGGGKKDVLAVFESWREMVTEEGKEKVREAGVDGIMVCTMDETHVEIVLSLRTHYPTTHIFCEKPLTNTLPSLINFSRALDDPTKPPVIFSIGHVLRYSPLIMLLKKLLCEDEVIGEIIHIDWTEPVGFWHFAHSYVRGDWAEESVSAPSLMTKCCHDVDILMWLLCWSHYKEKRVEGDGMGGAMTGSKPTHAGTPGKGVRRKPHFPAEVMSTGTLTHFRKKNKPKKAGDATNCLSCAAEPECIYSANKIYLKDSIFHAGWPNKKVVPDIEDLHFPRDYHKAISLLTPALSEDYSSPEDKIPGKLYYGRCVYESTNDVVDTQVTTFTWLGDDDDEAHPSTSSSTTENDGTEEPHPSRGRACKTATLTMIAHTHALCERRGRIYGAKGEISFSATENTITVHDFQTGQSRSFNPARNLGSGHGGGDWGITKSFVGAIRAVKSQGWAVERAMREWVGMGMEEAVVGHAAVWWAEEARRTGASPGTLTEWWERVNREVEVK